jgi:hypothetical protein
MMMEYNDNDNISSYKNRFIVNITNYHIVELINADNVDVVAVISSESSVIIKQFIEIFMNFEININNFEHENSIVVRMSDNDDDSNDNDADDDDDNDDMLCRICNKRRKLSITTRIILELKNLSIFCKSR